MNFNAKEMHMKKACLLGLGSLLLQSGLLAAQQPTAMLGAPVETSPVVAVQTPDTPLAEWTGSAWGRCAGCERIWGNAEFLMWWSKGAPVSTPLLTQATNSADPTAGQIGSANTSVLLGDRSYDLNTRYGGRFTLGGWLDSERTIGLEGTYLFIAPSSTTRTFTSNGAPGSPALAIPYLDVATGKEASFVFTGNAPGFVGVGGAFLHLANELQGGELNFAAKLIQADRLNLTGLLGFRYVNFSEDLDFGSFNTTPLNGGFYSALDSFRASNNFYGGQLGLRGEYRVGNFFVEATGKVALGVMNQVVDVNGSSNSSFPAPAPPNFIFNNAPGGFFAQPTNIGRHTHNAFAVVPEADLKVGYNITRNVQAFVSYNFLYLNDVARPGAVLDHNANPTQNPTLSGFPNTLTGPTAPAFSFSRSDFWAQGISFGVEFKF